MSWLTFVILVGVVWRVTRFIVADDLIAGTRKKVTDWLELRPAPNREEYTKGFSKDLLAYKGWTLITCPWCVSIYVSAGTLILTRIFVLDSIPMPVWTWLAVAAFSLVPYNYLDGDDH